MDGDGQRNRGFLHCKVLEKIGTGHAQRPDKRAQDEVGPGDGKDAAAKSQQQNGAKNQNAEGGPGLREHHGRDQGMAGKEAAVKNCLADRSGSTPAESCRGNKEIAPPWMLTIRRGAYWLLGSGLTRQASRPDAQDQSRP